MRQGLAAVSARTPAVLLSLLTSIVAFFTRIWFVIGQNAAGDEVRVQAACNAAAGIGPVVLIGSFIFAAPVVTPDYLQLLGWGNATITGAMTPTPGGGHAIACFTRDDLSSPSHVTSLTADPVPGALTISVASIAGIVDGATIFVSNNQNQCETFTVRGAPTGAGPYIVTLDEPILYAFPHLAASVGVFAQPRDIEIAHLIFQGGTGDRAISIVAAWNCECWDLRLQSPRYGDYQLSFDTGSRYSTWSDIYVDDTIYPAIAIEGSRGCMIDGLVVTKCGSADCAIVVQGSYDWTVRDAHVSGAAASGLHVGWTFDTIGCRGGRVEASSFIGNVVGITIDGGSSDVELTDVEVSYNSVFGVQVIPGGGAVPDLVRGKGVRFIGNAVHLYVDTAKQVRFTETHMKDATSAAVQIQANSELWLNGLDASEDLAQFTFINYGVMHVRDARISSTKTTGILNGAIFFRSLVTAPLLTLREVEINSPANCGAGISCGSGTVICEGVRSTGLAAGSYAGGLGLACLIRWRGAVTFASATTPITNDTLGAHQFDVPQVGGAN